MLTCLSYPFLVYLIPRVKGFVYRHHLTCSLVHLSKFLHCSFEERYKIPYKRNSRGLYSCHEISTAEYVFKKFFVLLRYSFLTFFGSSEVLFPFSGSSEVLLSYYYGSSDVLLFL